MKRLRELWINGKDGSVERLLSQSVNGLTSDSKHLLVDYLRQGRRIIVVAGISRDPRNHDEPISTPPHIATDGEWVWSEDLLYYLAKYEFGLPEEFILWAQSNNWIVPDIPKPFDFELPT